MKTNKSLISMIFSNTFLVESPDPALKTKSYTGFVKELATLTGSLLPYFNSAEGQKTIGEQVIVPLLGSVIAGKVAANGYVTVNNERIESSVSITLHDYYHVDLQVKRDSTLNSVLSEDMYIIAMLNAFNKRVNSDIITLLRATTNVLTEVAVSEALFDEGFLALEDSNTPSDNRYLLASARNVKAFSKLDAFVNKNNQTTAGVDLSQTEVGTFEGIKVLKIDQGDIANEVVFTQKDAIAVAISNSLTSEEFQVKEKIGEKLMRIYAPAGMIAVKPERIYKAVIA